MSKDPSTLLLEHHLKALKLPTVLRDYLSVAASCSLERDSYPQYLLRLLERELLDRERRSMERRLKEAQFPTTKTIESFDFAAQPSLNEALVRELLRGDYIGKKENVLLVCNPGTGKTHVASALGYASCTQGRRVRFFTTTGLVTQLLEQREARSLQRFLRQLERQDLLILDEPTTGLDPLMEQAFRSSIAEAANRGQTVFLSSHIMSEVEALCDRVAILRSGELIEVGALHELHHLGGRHLDVRFNGIVPDLSRLPGVANFTVQANRARFEVRGALHPSLAARAASDVITLDVREPSLEEVFLEHYGERS